MSGAFVQYHMYYRICDKISTPPYTTCIIPFYAFTPLSHAACISHVCTYMLSVRVAPIQVYLF